MMKKSKKVSFIVKQKGKRVAGIKIISVLIMHTFYSDFRFSLIFLFIFMVNTWIEIQMFKFEIETLLDQWEKNSDGLISYSEYLKYMDGVNDAIRGFHSMRNFIPCHISRRIEFISYVLSYFVCLFISGVS